MFSRLVIVVLLALGLSACGGIRVTHQTAQADSVAFRITANEVLGNANSVVGCSSQTVAVDPDINVSSSGAVKDVNGKIEYAMQGNSNRAHKCRTFEQIQAAEAGYPVPPVKTVPPVSLERRHVKPQRHYPKRSWAYPPSMYSKEYQSYGRPGPW